MARSTLLLSSCAGASTSGSAAGCGTSGAHTARSATRSSKRLPSSHAEQPWTASTRTSSPKVNDATAKADVPELVEFWPVLLFHQGVCSTKGGHTVRPVRCVFSCVLSRRSYCKIGDFLKGQAPKHSDRPLTSIYVAEDLAHQVHTHVIGTGPICLYAWNDLEDLGFIGNDQFHERIPTSNKWIWFLAHLAYRG